MFKVFQHHLILDHYQFYQKEWGEKIAARTVVNRYFNNEQRHTTNSVRKEQLVNFKKIQRKKE